MRFLLFILAVLPVFGISNSITIRNTSGSAQTNRVVTISRPFVQDEICDYAQPFIGGVGVSVWQNDRVNRWPVSATCPSGSVKLVKISWQATYAGSSITTIDFRNNSNPCSSGNQAACNAAALDEAGMLAFNGGTWTSTAVLTPQPTGTATIQTFNPKTVLDAGLFEYLLRGPAVTEVLVADRTSSRTTDFGWTDWKYNRLNTAGGGLILSTDTTITVLDGSIWATLPRPFTVAIDSEHMQICFVSGNTMYVGTTNGASSACATTAGRGVNGTTATFHSFGNGNFFKLVDGPYLTLDSAASSTTLTLNDASSINSETILQVGFEQIRVCNRSGNTLTVGTGSWGCAANSAGRGYNGTTSFATASNYQVAYTPVYNLTTSTDRWRDAPSTTFKSLHPEAVITFKKDQPGVGISYVIWNDWATSLQDQEYDIQINAGGSTVFSQTGIRHIARTNLRFPVYSQNDMAYWSGTAPGFLRINHNHTYLVQTGLVTLDPAIIPSATLASSLLTSDMATSGGLEPAWNGGNNDKCAADTKTTLNGSWNYVKGSMLRQIDTPGGRPDIMDLSMWESAYLYGMSFDSTTSDALEEMARSMPNCLSQVPWYVRETSTSAWCDNGDYPANPSDKSCTGANLTASAFGRFFSIDLHPEGCPMNQNTVSVFADKIFAVGPNTSNKFAINTGATSHLSSSILPAALFGDYHATELTIRLGGMYVTASEFVAYTVTTNIQDRAKARVADWGLQNRRDGIRSVAWTFRSVANGWYMAQDGSPEKEYLRSKLDRNIANWEGIYNLTTGNFYIPCPSPLASQYNYSPWCYGNNMSTTSLALLNFPSEPYAGSLIEPTIYNPTLVYAGESPWMRNYWLVAMASAEKKGVTQVRPFRKYYVGGSLVDSILNPQWSFWFESYYRHPMIPCAPEGTPVSPNCATQVMTASTAQQGFLSKTNRRNAFVSPLPGPSSGGNPTGPVTTAETDMMSGYFQISKAAMYLNRDVDFGSYSGKRAQEVFNQNIRFQNTCSDNPSWCPVVNPEWTITVTPGDTQALFTGTPVNVGNCKILISATLITNSDDSGDSNCTFAGSSLRHSATGLTAATTYYYRVTSNNIVRTYGTFTTTASAGGATTVTLKLKAPAGYGTVADVVTEYGSTTSLGTSVTTSCATSCSVSISGNAGRVIYYKNTWRNSTPTNLVSTSILSQMVQ